jgi:Domain of unknown function (DUF4386)
MKTSTMLSPTRLERVDAPAAEAAERADIANPAWRPLYMIGGVAALISAAIVPLAIVVYILWPPPTTVADYFAQFQSNKLVGLLNLDLLLVIGNLLGIPMFLALYVALRRVSQSLMAVALALLLVGIAAYFASNTSFNMLALSDQYASATTDAQRAMYLAAGQSMLAIYQGTAFHVNYVLGAVGGLIVAVVMLRSNIFSRLTAYLGIVANVFAFGLYVPSVGIFLSILSVLPLPVWDVLVALKLFQLARGSTMTKAGSTT